MKKYQHVAVIGIDGMGAFNRMTDTPCMDRIFAHGACTYDALSMDPTISAENWGGMLLGAEPAVHGLTNGYISCHPYANDALPSVFKRIRDHDPQAYLASVVNWEPINIGVVEDGLGVDKRTADNDAAVAESVIECVSKKPKFLFVQLDEVDGAGYHFGYGTADYLKKITEIDALVGKIHDAYVSNGMADDTLFLCIADHGGQNHGHGGWSETEKRVFLAASGCTVTSGTIGHAVTKDIAAIVLYALGLDVPAYDADGFSAQVPDGLFASAATCYRMPQKKEPPRHRETVPYFFPDGFGARFSSRVRLCQFFDGTLQDESFRHAIRPSGQVKFYSNGVCGDAAEFGATGAYTVEQTDLSRSFTLCFWILADAALPDTACVLGNKSPEHGLHQKKGFNVLLRNHAIMVQFGCGDDDTDTVTAFGTDGFRGWVHVALSFNTETGEVQCWLDFRLAHTDRIERKYMESLREGGDLVVGDDMRMRYNRERGLIFRMDDLLVLDGAADAADIAELEQYYTN